MCCLDAVIARLVGATHYLAAERRVSANDVWPRFGSGQVRQGRA